MCPGLTPDLHLIDDARKTAVIDRELLRLNVDIAALQETRLADNGTIKEANYTFYWQGKSPDQPRQHGVDFAVRNTLVSSTELPQQAQIDFSPSGCQHLPAQSTCSVYTPQPSAPPMRRRISSTKPWTKRYPGYPALKASTFLETSMQE